MTWAERMAHDPALKAFHHEDKNAGLPVWCGCSERTSLLNLEL